jgi:hypothetical protein
MCINTEAPNICTGATAFDGAMIIMARHPRLRSRDNERVGKPADLARNACQPC